MSDGVWVAARSMRMRGRALSSRLRFARSPIFGIALVAIAAGAGCTVAPYRPGFVELPPVLPSDAFERALEIVRLQYERIEFVEPEQFRLRSMWRTFQDREVAARSRATIWRERDELFALVEVQYLRVPAFGDPAWSSITGDRGRERDLLDRIQAALLDG